MTNKEQNEHPVIKVAKREVETAKSRSSNAGLPYVTLPVDHAVWLIEQAERAQELEKELEKANNKADYFKKEHGKLVGVGGMWINVSNKLEKEIQQNKRYREAIENALDEGMMSESTTQVMLKALEDEE